MNRTEVAIIILNWNGLEDTLECLTSLQKIEYQFYKVFVIDNGSKGNDVEVLEHTFGAYIDIIRNKKNLGYAKGVNIGIKYAHGVCAPDYYLLLNNDTIVDSHFLSRLVSAIENNATIGIAGPKVYFYDAPNVIQSTGDNLNLYTGMALSPGLKEADIGQYDEMRPVDWVGPCALIKKEVIERIGYLDESYFAYWEDVDFCIRAQRAGYEIYYVPDAKIWHKLERTSRSMPEFVYYHNTRNRLRFMKKYAPKLHYVCFMAYLCGYYVWIVSGHLVVSGKVKQLKAFWHGIRDGLFEATSYPMYPGE